jgi:hypothetical protein
MCSAQFSVSAMNSLQKNEKFESYVAQELNLFIHADRAVTVHLEL